MLDAINAQLRSICSGRKWILAFDAAAGTGPLVDLLYDSLHDIARKMIARKRPDHTLQAKGFLHEVWIKLSPQGASPELDRLHFVRLASRTIHNLLVDHEKRGYGWDRDT